MEPLILGWGWVCVLALVALPVAGCSDEATGTGGDGGTQGSRGDAFPCTEQGIRDAIAEGGGPFTFDCDAPQTVVTTAEIVIDKDVILDGAGALILNGNDDHRVLSVPDGVSAELRGLAVTGGDTSGEDEDGGSGINNRGTLALIDCRVSNHRAGGFADGGGIYNSGAMTLNGSTISSNLAWGGAGIYNSGELSLIDSVVSKNDGISAIFNTGELTVAGSTVSENSGGGIYSLGELAITSSTVATNTSHFCGAGISNDGLMSLTDSQVSSNTAIDRAFDYAHSFGGGVCNTGTATLTNTEVDGNSASGPCYAESGCPTGGGIVNYGSLTLSGSRANGNRADVGAGIYNTGELLIEDSWLRHHDGSESFLHSASGSMSMTNSRLFAGRVTVCGELIVHNSTLNSVGVSLGHRGSDGCDCVGTAVLTNATVAGDVDEAGCGGQATLFGTILMGQCSVPAVSNGYNIESPNDTCGFAQETDRANVGEQDLKPSEWRVNDHITLGRGSVAVDVIPEVKCLDATGEPLTDDQRGEPRPETGGTMCDVGAIEMQPDDVWPQDF